MCVVAWIIFFFFFFIKPRQLIISSLCTKEEWSVLSDVGLSSGWGAGHCGADRRAWRGPVGRGHEGAHLVTHTVLGAFLGLSHLEIATLK